MTVGGPFAGWTLELSGVFPTGVYLGWLLRQLGATLTIEGSVADDAALLRLLAARSAGHTRRGLLLRGPDSQAFRSSVRTTPHHDTAGCDDSLAWAWGGMASLTGDADGPPCAPDAPVASMCAALHLLLAFSAGLYSEAREIDLVIDLSDVVASLIEVSGLQYAVDGSVRSRNGDWWGRAGWGLYDCADGPIAVALRDRAQLLLVAEILGCPEMADESFADFAWGMTGCVDELNGLLVGSLIERDANDVVQALRAARIPAVQLRTLEEIGGDPQLMARGNVADFAGALLPVAPLPRGAATFMGTGGNGSVAPLAHLRVVDVSSVWAGPMAARLLADLGADVVKVTDPTKSVGSHRTGQAWDRDFYSILNDRNKRVFGADLRSPDVNEWLHQTLRGSDVLIENFGPGSAARLGLDATTLVPLHPGLSVLSMPALGLRGPDATAVGYGSTIEQAAGIGWLYADADGRPHRSGINFSDPIAGLYAAVAAVLLQVTRRRGGYELSQRDAAFTIMAPTLARLQVDGERPRRLEAQQARGSWVFVCPQCGASTPVRSVDHVVGSPSSSGSPSIEWIVHPDGKEYPLVLLPWQGSFARMVQAEPVEMPQRYGVSAW